jgi:DNA-binding PadR family transcriptional regulator
MDIRFTILGLLNWQPLSGYDLKRIIADSDLFYWSGNNNQIYNVLVELHKQGCVSQEIQYQESLPAKKVYSITAIGRAELRDWLLSEPELPEFRNNFLIQLAWMDELSGDELDACLARYANEMNTQLQMRLAQADRSTHTPDRTPRERFLWARINENLINMFQQELEWVTRLQIDLKSQNYST